MTDDSHGDFEKLVTLDDKDGGESPEQGAADWLSGGGTPSDDYTPSSLEDILAQGQHASGTPTPQDMETENASNAEARAKAIAGGMDENQANIIYPEFSTPEDMNRIN
jgi:hypothetical protein